MKRAGGQSLVTAIESSRALSFFKKVNLLRSWQHLLIPILKVRSNSMERKIIRTKQAPETGLPLSQAIQLGPFVFTSGMIARDPVTGDFVGGDIERQTERVLLNLKAVLEAAGSSLDKVVKVTVFLKDMRDFGEMNKVYRTFFSEAPPARATVEVSKLGADALVEMEMVAGT